MHVCLGFKITHDENLVKLFIAILYDYTCMPYGQCQLMYIHYVADACKTHIYLYIYMAIRSCQIRF